MSTRAQHFFERALSDEQAMAIGDRMEVDRSFTPTKAAQEYGVSTSAIRTARQRYAALTGKPMQLFRQPTGGRGRPPAAPVEAPASNVTVQEKPMFDWKARAIEAEHKLEQAMEEVHTLQKSSWSSGGRCDRRSLMVAE
jgi:hypothetical protein